MLITKVCFLLTFISLHYGFRPIHQIKTFKSSKFLKLLTNNDFYSNEFNSNIRYDDNYEELPLLSSKLYPTTLSDEEVLDMMYQQRQLENDRWQSHLFRENHSGVWNGKSFRHKIYF